MCIRDRLAKAQEGLEPHPDGFQQQGLTARLVEMGEADLEVGVGDVGLLPGDAQQQGGQVVGQLVPCPCRHPGQQGEQSDGQPAAPQTGVQQARMKRGVKHRILCGHGRHRIIKTERHFSDPDNFFYPAPVSYTHLDVYKRQAQELGKQSPLCMSLVDSLGGHG